MVLTPAQCRAARALLGWSAEDLAKAGGFGIMTVKRLEGGQPVNAVSMGRIISTLESAGIILIGKGEATEPAGEGVRLISPPGGA
jgi:transcriptional regulator with XRE-family HTH domain